MHGMKRAVNFMLWLLFNLLLDLKGIIPAAALLVLHYILKLSVWWPIAAAAFWILRHILLMLLFDWANRCGSTPDLPKKNINPYSPANLANLKSKIGDGADITPPYSSDSENERSNPQTKEHIES